MWQRFGRARIAIAAATAALGVATMLAAPVSAAAPVENGWDSIVGGRAFDSCTGEYFDNSGKVHSVVFDSGLFHFNVHVAGIGESSGDTYQYDAEDNEHLLAAPDGTYNYDQVLNFSVVTQGSSSNQRLTIRLRQVYDSQGNLISEKSDFSFACQGS